MSKRDIINYIENTILYFLIFVWKKYFLLKRNIEYYCLTRSLVHKFLCVESLNLASDLANLGCRRLDCLGKGLQEVGC